MGLVARKKATSDIPPLAGGVYMATCCGVVDFGEQPNKFKLGKYQDKILLIFEVADEFVEVEGEKKPRWLSKEFTLSLHDKSKLKEVLASWLGNMDEVDELDMTEIIGDACQLQVAVKTSKDGTHQYNVITNIMALMRGMTPPPLISEPIVFDMQFDLEHATEVLAMLPEWMQQRVMQSPTWAARTANSQPLDVQPGNAAAQSKPAQEVKKAAPVAPGRRPSF